jgi:hypothetical protein
LSALDLLQKFGVREVDRFELPIAAESDHGAHVVNGAIAAARGTKAEQIWR